MSDSDKVLILKGCLYRQIPENIFMGSDMKDVFLKVAKFPKYKIYKKTVIDFMAQGTLLKENAESFLNALDSNTLNPPLTEKQIKEIKDLFSANRFFYASAKTVE